MSSCLCFRRIACYWFAKRLKRIRDGSRALSKGQDIGGNGAGDKICCHFENVLRVELAIAPIQHRRERWERREREQVLEED